MDGARPSDIFTGAGNNPIGRAENDPGLGIHKGSLGDCLRGDAISIHWVSLWVTDYDSPLILSDSTGRF